ncbi:MAG: FAD:protein FMN transferase [Frankiales bacterium]|nr:FAD:protein FMN transferase [Frankiales bacterium]
MSTILPGGRCRISACGRLEPVTPRRSWVQHVMGLPVSILARGELACSAGADAAVRAVHAELVEVDAVFSPYRPGSAVSRLGRRELRLLDCPPEVSEVAERCEAARRRTAGAFDSLRPDGAWDPSGLVKGWAVERAARHLAAVPVDWCLNAGGDVLVLSPSGEPFGVGVQDPRDSAALVTTVQRASGAVATSGTAARGAHLYDPRTGAAALPALLSVTVIGPSLETADVLATAAFVSGDPGWAAVVTAADGYEGLAVSATGQLSATRAWPR